MRANGIMANLRVADIEAAKAFYTDFLGLSTEVFNMGWVARYASPETGARVQLVTRDATASARPARASPRTSVTSAPCAAPRRCCAR